MNPLKQISFTKKPKVFRGKPVVRMHAMIKPIGPVCNLNCTYCFYLSKQELLETDSQWRMSDETLEKFIKQYIEGHNHKQIIFSWQGGEPTLLGLDFFKRVIELQKKYSPSYVRCENDLQTNGTLLDDNWCRFLKENNFLVGLSIDGPRELHDFYRVGNDNKGSFDRVVKSAKLLKKYGVRFATLTCINRKTSEHPLKVYRFLRDIIGSRQMQFIPIVEPKDYFTTAPHKWKSENMPIIGTPAARPGNPESVVADWNVDPDKYGEFLIKVFNEWKKYDIRKINIPFFDSAVEQWSGKPSPLCIFAPICGKGLALEHDGNVYSCDHYVYPEYKLGNINNFNIKELAFAPKQEAFGYAKDSMLPNKCRQCKYLFACSGECPKNRFIRSEDGEPGLNYLCSGLYKYFDHINPHIKKINKSIGFPISEDVPD